MKRRNSTTFREFTASLEAAGITDVPLALPPQCGLHYILQGCKEANEVGGVHEVGSDQCLARASVLPAGLITITQLGSIAVETDARTMMRTYADGVGACRSGHLGFRSAPRRLPPLR